MSAKLVPIIKTEFSKQALTEALIIAWRKIYDYLPSKQQIAILFANWSIETNQNTICYNWNFGKLRHFASNNGCNIKYIMVDSVTKLINGQKIILYPPNPGTWFRSFSNLEESAMFYIDMIKTHYPSRWKAVVEGDPTKFYNIQVNCKSVYANVLKFYFEEFMNNDDFNNIITDLTEMITVKMPIIKL
jgi:hypothetical protein